MGYKSYEGDWKMKKQELIERIMRQQHWEDAYIFFARKGMEKSTKKELLKFFRSEEDESEGG